MAKMIDSAEKVIKAVSEQAEKERSERRRKIESAEAELAQAIAEMDKASKAGNDSEYLKAHNSKRDLEAVIAMNKDRLDVLEKKPLATPEEYNRIKSTIIKSTEDELKEKKEKVRKKLEEVFAIAEELQAILDKGNGLLEAWRSATNYPSSARGNVVDYDIAYLRSTLPKNYSITRIMQGE